MNAQTKLSAKGQVVIPKSVRDRLRWSVGDQLEVIETADGILLKRRPVGRTSITIEQFLAERPRYEGLPASIEDMNEAIERGRAERWAAKEKRSR